MHLLRKIQRKMDNVVEQQEKYPRGLVIGQNLYGELMRDEDFCRHFVAAYMQMDPTIGDTFMGMEVSISRREDTLRVY